MEGRRSIDLLNYRAGLESALPEQVTNSDVFVTLDTKTLIFDIKGTRIQITDFETGLTEAEIKSLLAPLPKFYLSSDTHRLFRYMDDVWCSMDCKDDTYTKEEIDDKFSELGFDDFDGDFGEELDEETV